MSWLRGRWAGAWAFVVLVLVSGTAAAQDLESLTAEVTEVLAPRRFVIDRGAEDGVEVGDAARLERAGLQAIGGRVVQVDEESATVQLTGLPGQAALGAPVAVDVPQARLGIAGDGGRPQPIPVLGPEDALPEPALEAPQEPVTVAGRVLELLGPRQVRIDLGADDALIVRDLVALGEGHSGRVVSVEDDSALVFVRGGKHTLEIGTPVRFEVPGERLAPEPVVLHDKPAAAVETAEREESTEGALESSAAAPEGASDGFLVPLAAAPTQEPIDPDATVLVSGRLLRLVDPQRVTIDRGKIDGLAVGDEVLLVPRNGPPLRGRVSAVGDRSADVDLPRTVIQPELGMRVEIEVPESRLARVPTEPLRQQPFVRVAGGEQESLSEEDRWSNEDEDWREGMPLLAGLESINPSERAPEFGGRVYSINDYTHTSDEGRSTQFYRLGVNLWGENYFGRGERIQFDGEWNRQVYNLPDIGDPNQNNNDDLRENQLRVDRLSYAEGGDRFDPTSFEVGRFLHRGLPELGVIDGVEWRRRLANGDSFGFSAGYLPEPNDEFESGEDLSVSAYYRWVFDQSEVLSATLGAQKTWHNFEADRDLVVARFDYLPPAGWRMHGSALIDYYSDSDEEADRSIGVTQAWLTANRNWGNRLSVDLRYRHFEFPTLERTEFLPQVLEEQLADDRRDRVSGDARMRILPGTDLRAGVGGWIDEDDQGGDAIVGLSWSGDSARASRIYVDFFGVDGRFTSVWGGRTGVGIQAGNQRLDAFYELSNQDQKGFVDNNDDFIQHRGRMAWTYNALRNLQLSAYVDGTVYNSEYGLTLGVFIQWSF